MESLAFGLVNVALWFGFLLGCYASYCLLVDPDSEIEHGHAGFDRIASESTRLAGRVDSVRGSLVDWVKHDKA